MSDELNPSATELDAQAYRRLRDVITATMDGPDRWDRDADEGSVLEEYVRWLADGKPARDDSWDDDAPARTTLPDVLRGAADRIDSEDVPQTAQDTADFIDGARWATGQLRAIAAEADASPGDPGWLPDWLTELAREHAATLLRDDIGNAVDALARVRRLHDALAGEDLLTSPDDEITRGAAAKKIAAALDGWTPPADRFPASLLSGAERGMLRFALELAEERMFSRGNEFSEADHEAVKSLKRLAGEEER